MTRDALATLRIGVEPVKRGFPADRGARYRVTTCGGRSSRLIARDVDGGGVRLDWTGAVPD